MVFPHATDEPWLLATSEWQGRPTQFGCAAPTGAVLIGFVASLVPARRASNVDPIEVIRSG